MAATIGEHTGKRPTYGMNDGILLEGMVVKLHDGSFHYIQYVNTSGAYVVPLAAATRTIEGRAINFTAGGRTISACSLVEIVNPLVMGGNSQEYRRYVKMSVASGKAGMMDQTGIGFDAFDSTELAEGITANLDETDSVPTTRGTDMAKKAAKANGKAKTAAREKTPKTVRNCVCGCGTETTGHFAPGHDARYHGWIKKLEDGRIQKNGKDAKSGEQVVPASLLHKMDLVASKDGFKAKNPDFYKE